MHRRLLLLLVAVSLRAETADTLIDKALSHHDSLKAIEQRIDALDALADKSRHFADPEIALTVNDIQLDAPTDRSIEPMQFSAVNVRQKFPWFGKRDAATSQVEARKAVLFSSLEAAQAELALRIRRSVYTIAEYKAQLAVIGEYLKLAQQKIDLSTAYTTTRGSSHMGIMSAELLRAKIAIRREKLAAALKAEKARLAYLVQAPVAQVEADGNVEPPLNESVYLDRLEQNRGYRVMLKNEKAAEADVKVSRLSENADPVLVLGYYHRESYEDYVSVTVGATLPIYGSQSDETEAARHEKLAASAAAADYRAKLTGEIKAAYAALEQAYNTYRILSDESIPLAKHMVDLGDADIRSGSDLFAYFDVLERKLGFDEERIAAKADYLRAQAQLKALMGVIR